MSYSLLSSFLISSSLMQLCAYDVIPPDYVNSISIDAEIYWLQIQILGTCFLYSPRNIVLVIKSRKMRWTGNVARVGEGRGVYRVLVAKPQGKKPVGRTRHRWEDNIKMDLQEVGCGGMDWIELAQVRDRWGALVNAVMVIQVPLNARNYLTSCKPVSFSRKALVRGVSE
jgi:hypothetical protein